MPRFTLFVLLVAFVSAIGCDPPANTSTDNSESPPVEIADATDTPPPSNDPPVNVTTTFGSTEEAIGVLVESAKANEHEQRQAAETWLAGQGESAVAPLTEVMNTDSDLRAQVAASLALQKLGPPAFDTLVEATNHSQSMVRVNAVKGVAAIKPPTKRTVDVLLELLKHEDNRVKHAAIAGLGSLGGKAERAGDPLVAILNSKADDGLRNAAKAALKKVNPRKTFQD